MKIKIISDLHLEGGELEFTYKHSGEDVLILAGDIHTRCRHDKFIQSIPEHVEILMVAGNHEYYRSGHFDKVNQFFKDLQWLRPNFHFLNNESINIDGVDFYGGLMCTDLLLYGFDPLIEIDVKHCINDFTYILTADGNRTRTWNIDDHKEQHEIFTYGLKGFLNRTEGCKRVVISHFAPTQKAIAPQYQMSKINPYFVSDMEHLMGWEGIWCFGHVHNCYDGQIGDTRLICNPKGYGHYENRMFDENLIVEI